MIETTALMAYAIGTAAPPDDDVQRMAKELLACRARIQSMAEVPCVEHALYKQTPMRCFLKDRCSFCRARELEARIRALTFV